MSENRTSNSDLGHGPKGWGIRLGILGFLVVLIVSMLLCQKFQAYRVQSALGAIGLIGLVALFSRNLMAVSWRTVFLGFFLQIGLALFILKWEINGLENLGIPQGFRPGYSLFETLAGGVTKFMDFTQEGARFVFGKLANAQELEKIFGPNSGFIVAFNVLPPLIFASCFFSILYYFGVLQWVVRAMARLMIYLLGTSGAETLSASANVFLGQTEAPLIIKPYIGRMTQSELLAMMVGGMATISGGMMVVYIGLGADRIGILATSVMAAPCSLYLTKLFLPETEKPLTRGSVHTEDEPLYANVIDAAAAGASDGMKLAINVAAMLIAFLALLAMVNYLLGTLATGQSLWDTIQESRGWWALAQVLAILTGFLVICALVNFFAPTFCPGIKIHNLFGPGAWLFNGIALLAIFSLYLVGLNWSLTYLPENIQLTDIFGFLFSPLAFFMGIERQDIFSVADLLGTKLAANEFIAFVDLRDNEAAKMTRRSVILSTYALTGFANFGSVGIQIGGIGALAPERRSELARLGIPALFLGFFVSLVNAAIAGIFLDVD